MRLIDADALFTAFENAGWYDNRDREEVAEDILMDAPTIDQVRHGRWIDTGGYVTTAYGHLDVYRCSSCAADVTIDDHDSYCPSCGAKMDGDHEV